MNFTYDVYHKTIYIGTTEEKDKINFLKNYFNTDNLKDIKWPEIELKVKSFPQKN